MPNPYLASIPPILFSEQIREIELTATSGGADLMERAGLSVARLAQQVLSSGKSILLVAGPGNNGGDALVAARHLRQWWFDVHVVFAGEVNNQPADARNAFSQWSAAGGQTTNTVPLHKSWDLVIDGLFGIGLKRNLEGAYLDYVNTINDIQAPVISIDIPSGLHADTGNILGNAVHATHTITFLGLKPGLLTHHGPDYCGNIHIDMLSRDISPTPCASGRLLDESILKTVITPRRFNSHKGQFGNVGILGGARGMTGAAILAGRAALKLGVGRVYLGMLDTKAPAVDLVQPELMIRTAQELVHATKLDCLICGPGLGQSADAFFFLQAALQTDIPLILDADALNLISVHTNLHKTLKHRRASTILTPHPTEAARLLHADTETIQSDRIKSTLQLARTYQSFIVLKGAGSVIATPEENWFINRSGNPGMASAGMGDVLSGIIGALLVQYQNIEHTLLAAVYLHGAAADNLVDSGISPAGLTASEVVDSARHVLGSYVPLTTLNAISCVDCSIITGTQQATYKDPPE